MAPFGQIVKLATIAALLAVLLPPAGPYAVANDRYNTEIRKLKRI